ncbi:unnamed protein product [Cylicostephanus goldi]|uniref:Uncharacterized protein n=1 Tax=Cylicostephanus goldi TaxID=71465 RepID=A0A3P6RAG9_CYLGO|nr:unnamed protein product [Cylicostephanus goldi]
MWRRRTYNEQGTSISSLAANSRDCQRSISEANSTKKLHICFIECTNRPILCVFATKTIRYHATSRNATVTYWTSCTTIFQPFLRRLCSHSSSAICSWNATNSWISTNIDAVYV